MLSDVLLATLRAYWAAVRPPLPYLFPGRDGGVVKTNSLFEHR
jgi:integrase